MKGYRNLCKRSQQGVKYIASSGEAKTHQARSPNVTGKAISFASRSFLSSAPRLTLTAAHRLCGQASGLQEADCQRRCFASKPRSRTHYYDVLVVSPKATQGEIKSAYYKLSKVYHPDINKKEESKMMFTQISEAYEILGNTRKRRMYDHGIYSRNEPPTDEQHDYTQSFRQREGFGFERQAPPTGRTSKYNFDEFYQQHYGNTVRQEKAEREYMKRMEEHLAIAEMERKLRTVATGFVILSLVMMFFINSDSEPGKRPASNKSSTKKD